MKKVICSIGLLCCIAFAVTTFAASNKATHTERVSTPAVSPAHASFIASTDAIALSVTDGRLHQQLSVIEKQKVASHTGLGHSADKSLGGLTASNRYTGNDETTRLGQLDKVDILQTQKMQEQRLDTVTLLS
jgi:hypothetical protein